MSPFTPNQPVEYRLDRDDRIIAVNDAFVDFAAENGAPNLPGRVLGTSIWAHLRGSVVQELYRAIFEDVRESGKAARFEYRCDAEGTIRRMRMNIEFDGQGSLRMRSVTIEITTGQPGVVPLLEQGSATQLISGCSFCSRVFGPPWMPVREAAEERSLLALGELKITHGVCPDCYGRILEEGAV